MGRWISGGQIQRLSDRGDVWELTGGDRGRVVSGICPHRCWGLGGKHTMACDTTRSATRGGGESTKPLFIARYHAVTLQARGKRSPSDHGGDDQTVGNQSSWFFVGCDGEPSDRGAKIDGHN